MHTNGYDEQCDEHNAMMDKLYKWHKVIGPMWYEWFGFYAEMKLFIIIIIIVRFCIYKKRTFLLYLYLERQ